MAEVVPNAEQEFWRSPAVAEPAVELALPAPAQEMADACAHCATEFMIGAKFCHTCGWRRRVMAAPGTNAATIAVLWARSLAWLRPWASSVAASWSEISFPDWLRYLHFHEIKRWVGLPTAALIAFMIGLGCVAGAIGVSLFYRASNLAEFQAIQMWRIEWLLAATASFVAGILLKKPSDSE
ncbi:MAG TPA: hypothetical protein VK706_12410 [Candidatus Sulfotelmatobacter sp.]|jgi:hypothetical protein|nr:hypothetical protein [Candidatus Sulfotelmatobacter sp.]